MPVPFVSVPFPFGLLLRKHLLHLLLCARQVAVELRLIRHVLLHLLVLQHLQLDTPSLHLALVLTATGVVGVVVLHGGVTRIAVGYSVIALGLIAGHRARLRLAGGSPA